MSSLRTLQEAFSELERQADALPDRPDPLQRRETSRKHVSRRALVVAASVVGAAVVVAGAIVGTSLSGGAGHDGDGVQPAGPTASHPVVLWKAENATCPSNPPASAFKGAVLPSDSGCVRLVQRLATFRSLDATVAGTGGRWWVEVNLDEGQNAQFAHAAGAAKGARLAMVDSGRVLSAPVVEEVSDSASIMIRISAESEAQATYFAELLTTPGHVPDPD